MRDQIALVREAWGMIERAEPGDVISVGVALDYVMDGLGCERDAAKTEMYRHVARVLTDTIPSDEANFQNGRPAISPATHLANYLFSDDVKSAKQFISGYASTSRTSWAKSTKRLVKLCSWVQSCE